MQAAPVGVACIATVLSIPSADGGDAGYARGRSLHRHRV